MNLALIQVHLAALKTRLEAAVAEVAKGADALDTTVLAAHLAALVTEAKAMEANVLGKVTAEVGVAKAEAAKLKAGFLAWKTRVVGYVKAYWAHAAIGAIGVGVGAAGHLGTIASALTAAFKFVTGL